MRTRRLLLVLALIITIYSIYAVPQTINFQGALKDTNGEPVNQFVDMTFRIYDSETGGTLLWEESQNSIQIENGIFNAILGLDIVFGDALFDNENLWLTFRISGDSNEMSPRQKINSVPYSIQAQKAIQAVKSDTTTTISGIPLTGLVQKDGSGNITTSGDITANSFIGDGSGLTGITAIYDSLYIHKTGPDTMSANSSNPTLTINNSGNGDGISVESARIGISIDNASYNAIDIGSVDQDGIRISATGNTALFAVSADFNGLEIGATQGDGIYLGYCGIDGLHILDAGNDGVSVTQAGNPSSYNVSNDKNGFEVEGAEGNGLFIGHTDINGIYIKKTAVNGVYIDSTSQYGMMINSTGNDGIRVYQSAHYGLNIDSAVNGINIGQTTNDGIFIGYPHMDGLSVGHAGDAGVDVVFADGDGVSANTTDTNGEYGLYTPDKIYGSNLTTRTINNIGRNSGSEELEAGDIVCLSGYEENVIGDSNIPIIKITKEDRNNSLSVIGIVEYKVYIREENEEYEGKTITRKSFRFAEGNANKGDYVSIIILGPADVKVNSKEDIKTGERLTSNNGIGRKISKGDDYWATGIIGKAMEDSNGKDKMKVYINCK